MSNNTPNSVSQPDKNPQKLGSLFDLSDASNPANKSRDITLGGSQKVKFAPTIPVRRTKKVESTPSLLETPTSTDPSQQKPQAKSNNRKIDRVVTVSGPVSGIFSTGPSSTNEKPKGIGGIVANPYSYRAVSSDSSVKIQTKSTIIGDVIENQPSVNESEVKFIDQTIHDNHVDEKVFLFDESLHQNELFIVQIENLPKFSVENIIEDLHHVEISKEADLKNDAETKSEIKDGSDKQQVIDLNESLAGNIGSIRIRKSGKIELVIGKVVFNLQRGAPSSFMQSVAAVDDENAQFFDLGPLKERFCCIPEIK